LFKTIYLNCAGKWIFVVFLEGEMESVYLLQILKT